MEEIRKNGLKRLINRHRDNVGKIQSIVTDMVEVGFDFATAELRDLSSSRDNLHKQAKSMAKKEASRLKITFRRNADYVETLEHLNHAIRENAQTLSRVLLYHTQSPLEVGAYEVVDGVVRLSSRWLEEKEQEYTILPTDRREQTKRLVNNVRQAIGNSTHLSPTTAFLARAFLHWMMTADACAGLTRTEISMRKRKIMNLSKGIEV